MSRFTDAELAAARRLMTDFETYAPACLKIRTKSGAVTTFRLNRTQAHLHSRLEKQRQERGRVRALVLKGRQVGISTYIAGRFYWRVTHGIGLRAFILTHLDAASENLFGMAKRFHDMCPDEVRPTTGKANAKVLAFPGLDSGYRVGTAGSADVGRGETIQLFHGSEVGFWPNAQTHAAGIRQAIANAPGTESLFESTANGIGNVFHAEWQAAMRGESDYEPIFLPWYWHEEYTAPVDVDWQPPSAWLEYETLYGLNRSQTFWAYKKNAELVPSAGGSVDEPCWQFRQEYPANAEEAFQTTGGNTFITADKVMSARKAKVVGSGPIILGVDPARGGGDKTGVIDRQGRRLGGHVCKRLDQTDLMAVAGAILTLARDLKPKGLKKVVVDTTGLGAGLYDRLRELMPELVEGVNFAAQAYDRERYVNRRAEMWATMRDWVHDPAGVQIPDEDVLHAELTAPVHGPGATRLDSHGRLQLEAKEHIRERLNFSPDLGDAAALTFALGEVIEAQTEMRKPKRWLIA